MGYLMKMVVKPQQGASVQTLEVSHVISDEAAAKVRAALETAEVVMAPCFDDGGEGVWLDKMGFVSVHLAKRS